MSIWKEIHSLSRLRLLWFIKIICKIRGNDNCAAWPDLLPASLFAPLCLLWEHMLVWDILHQAGQPTVPEPQSLVQKLWPALQIPCVPSFSQWLTHSGPALITLTRPASLLWDTSPFSAWEPEAGLCVSQMKHLTSLIRVFYFRHCCRKLSVKCASGAAVCSSPPLGQRAHRLSIWTLNPHVCRQHHHAIGQNWPFLMIFTFLHTTFGF